jgi:nicotinamidase/pyrazinamidase
VAEYRLGDEDVLIAVDLQNDFCSGGALAVPEGDLVVPIVNRVAPLFRHVLMTQDWHPPGHRSFASAHPGRAVFETVEVDYGQQVLWPDHCVQETRGAAFHKDVRLPQAELVLRKGYHRMIDSYSAFYENDRTTPTGLTGYLRTRGLKRLFLAGLATDFCVLYSAEDARREGFAVVVLEDACRAIDLGGSLGRARERMAEIGVELRASAALAG